MDRKESASCAIVRLSALGDVAMTLPWVYDFANQNPRSSVLFISKPAHAKLLINPPDNLIFYPFDTKKEGSVWGVIKWVIQLHRKYPKVVFIDLHDVLRTKLMRLYLKITWHKVIAIKKPRKERKRLLAPRKEQSVPRELYVPSMHYLYKQTLEKAIPNKRKLRGRYMIKPRNDNMRKGAPVQQSQRATVGIAPYAGHPQKEYPEDKMITLIDKILKNDSKLKIILYTAHGDERTKAQKLIALSPERISFSSAKGLSEELKEMTSLSCMISMDSANQHLASLVGTPVITLWGATHPAAGFKAFNQCAENQLGASSNERPHSIYGEKSLSPEKIDEMFDIPIEQILQRVKHYTFVN